MEVFEGGILAAVLYIGWGLAKVAIVLKAIEAELANARWERTQLARLRLRLKQQGQ